MVQMDLNFLLFRTICLICHMTWVNIYFFQIQSELFHVCVKTKKLVKNKAAPAEFKCAESAKILSATSDLEVIQSHS